MRTFAKIISTMSLICLSSNPTLAKIKSEFSTSLGGVSAQKLHVVRAHTPEDAMTTGLGARGCYKAFMFEASLNLHFATLKNNWFF